MQGTKDVLLALGGAAEAGNSKPQDLNCLLVRKLHYYAWRAHR